MSLCGFEAKRLGDLEIHLTTCEHYNVNVNVNLYFRTIELLQRITSTV